MAKHSHRRAQWNRRQAINRLDSGQWFFLKFRSIRAEYLDHQKGAPFLPSTSSERWSGVYFRGIDDEVEKQRLAIENTQKRLGCSVHYGVSSYSRSFRRLWRRQARRIERLYAIGLCDEADNLDPQPRRLGIMRFIY